MAGGKRSRLTLKMEKPLLKLGAKTLLERVVDTLRKARYVDRIIVAVSPHTPKTTRIAKSLHVEVVKTPGRGYVKDFQFAIKHLCLRHTLIISADLPFIKPEIIDQAITRYKKAGKPALTVVTRVDGLRQIGLKAGYSLQAGSERVSPVGINIVDGSRIDEAELPQELLVVPDSMALFNINTKKELLFAQRIIRGRDEV